MAMSLTDWNALHGSTFQDMPVLVTGGAGFIGSHLSRALVGLGAKVTVLDDLSGGDEDNLTEIREAIRFEATSLLDAPTMQACVQDQQVIFHLAALGSVPRSVREPGRYHLANTTGTALLLEAARQSSVQRIVFSASSSAYGDTPTLPKIETMPVQPRSPYAATKVACEAMMRAYGNCYDLDTVSLRYFNIFGPRQNANSAYAAVIAAFAKALAAGERPQIYGDGEQSRDFTYVDNAVHANLLGAAQSEALQGQVVNIACSERITVNHLAALMAEAWGRPDLKPEHLEDRAGDVRHSLAELSAAAALIQYQPIVKFATGLMDTVAWYRQTMTSVDANAD